MLRMNNMYAYAAIPSKVSRVASSARRLNQSVMLSFSSSTDDNTTTTIAQQPKRRTRRRHLPIDGNESIPSLADFMHRAKVRKQYRNFIRLAHFVDGNNTPAGREGRSSTGECRAALEEVRLSYQMGIKKGTDNLSKTMAFNDGERRLRQLEAMVGYNRRSTTSVDEKASAEESYEADSWINIKDEEDKRGRVGVAWPWERDNELK
ncbi:hypothetical protein ACHAXM_009114 [Skeletonema potamos]